MLSKLYALTLGLVLGLLFLPAVLPATEKNAGYRTIHTQELKQWIDSGKQFQLIDARPKKYAKGEVIVGAKFLSYGADESIIAQMLPSKDATIVVYCASVECPMSGKLAKQLVKLGYKHVYKYPEGIDEWYEKQYPVEDSGL